MEYPFTGSEEGNTACILALMGETANGDKEIIAIADGYCESRQSRLPVLLDAMPDGAGLSRPEGSGPESTSHLAAQA